MVKPVRGRPLGWCAGGERGSWCSTAGGGWWVRVRGEGFLGVFVGERGRGKGGESEGEWVQVARKEEWARRREMDKQQLVGQPLARGTRTGRVLRSSQTIDRRCCSNCVCQRAPAVEEAGGDVRAGLFSGDKEFGGVRTGFKLQKRSSGHSRLTLGGTVERHWLWCRRWRRQQSN